MLIFISDIHFVDGTAKENVSYDAFVLFFESIASKCEWLKRDGRKIKEIKIVFLGDIFDLLRTEMWFSYPVDERPWGNKEDKIEEHANKIFEAIIKANERTFELLGGELKDRFKLPCEPERIYIPGNHDRLCNKYQSLREKVCRCLGIPVVSEPFEHTYLNKNYGVFARHGHEYDKFNYEGGVSYTYENYMRVPIGDPITTEIVAKIPFKLMKRKEIQSLPQNQQAILKRNFQEIENVRPFSAVVEWLLYQVKKNLYLKEVIEEVVDEVIKEFNELEFVKKRYQHHDKWTDFWDEADKIQAVLFLLEKFKIYQMEKIMPLLEKVKRVFERDDYVEAALKEHAGLDWNIRYVVYGHTHEPKQVSLRVVAEPYYREDVYLNTGTWTTQYYRCREGLGFTGWKNMSYVIFYRPEERGTEFPVFETWTGSLKTI